MNPELFSFSTEDHSHDSPQEEDRRYTPLPHRIRPDTLETFIGQKHLLDNDKLLHRIIKADTIQSTIFFGPAGCGKTTLAHIIANITHSYFVHINAVNSNSHELRSIITKARSRRAANRQRKTILFIDEIHRFNKAQQDILMPVVENGDIILIGATTHNPSFSINGPLLSRALVFELHPLSVEHIQCILRNALANTEYGFGAKKIECADEALEYIATYASGAARRALIALEIAVNSAEPDSDGVIHVTESDAAESTQKKIIQYDQDGDYHYDTISAFIKSLRGSDPDASVYWLAKMIEAGEDPLFIVRRMIILASEDIGNADPHALQVAVSGLEAVQFVGMPEARIILSHIATYLASAPKSNAAYKAIDGALRDIRAGVVEEVPQHLRDSHYSSAKKMGRGQDYVYPHSFPYNYVPQKYKESDTMYYYPSDNGYEKTIKKRLAFLRTINKKGNENDF